VLRLEEVAPLQFWGRPVLGSKLHCSINAAGVRIASLNFNQLIDREPA
jgi:hypothetical protein